MKKINIILMILVLCLGTDFYAQKEDFYASYNCNSSQNLLVQQSAVFCKKHAWILAILPVIAYHHQEIKNMVAKSPYISSALLYITLHYLCDAFLNYQQQEMLLKIIALLKKTTLCLVITHGIKNHILEKNLILKDFIDEAHFLQIITEKLPYSFDETTIIALKAYQEIKSSLQSLHGTVRVESEEFVFLCHASSINMRSLLYLVQNDPIVYEMLYHFEKTPETHFTKLMHYLASETTKTFIELEYELRACHIRSQSSS